MDVAPKLASSLYFGDLLLPSKMIANSKIQPRFNLIYSKFSDSASTWIAPQNLSRLVELAIWDQVPCKCG